MSDQGSRIDSFTDGSTLPTPRRIAIVGNAGCGKTTLARSLSAKLGIHHVELDALHWGADWTAPPLERFRQQVGEALAADSWIADGNYGKAQDIIWSRADTLVYLDYPLWLTLWRLLRRTLKRVSSKEQLWNGNRENWREAFLARDNLFLYSISTHRKRRLAYAERLRQPMFAHLHTVWLTNPRGAARWLSSLDPETREPASD